jgi:hypothetical protein
MSLSTEERHMKVTVYITDAPAFIAGLVKEGLTFDAVQKSDTIEITLTGGY